MLQHDGRVLKQMWLLWCCSCTSFQCGLQFNSSLVCPSADPSIYRLFSVIRWCNVCICMQYALSTYVSIHLQPCRCRVLVVFYFFAASGTSVATLQKTLRVSWEGQQKVLARPHWNLFSKGCPYCSFGASRSRGAGLARMVETLQEWEGNATPKVRTDKYDHWFYSCASKKIDIDIITTYYNSFLKSALDVVDSVVVAWGSELGSWLGRPW